MVGYANNNSSNGTFHGHLINDPFSNDLIPDFFKLLKNLPRSSIQLICNFSLQIKGQCGELLAKIAINHILQN